MMLRKPTCADCPHNLQYMERLPIKKKGVTMHLGERFCVAGKRARKFKRSDPKTYVPSWCPRLKAPCELRIYGLKNQREWRMHRSMCAYLGEDTSYDIKNQAILDRLKGVPKEQRTARFVCAIAAVMPDGALLTTEGTIEGRIGYEERGKNGFGYDPIFLVPPYVQTSAELTEEEKNAISHRGNALRSMRLKIEEYINEGTDCK